MVKLIIKRVIVAVCVISILKWISNLTGTGFIVPVYAESGGGGGASLVQDKPEPIIGVDSTTGSNSTVSTMHGLSSNAFIEGAYEYPEFGLFQYGINSSLCNNESGLCPVANSPTAEYYKDQLQGGNFELKESDSDSVYVYGSNIYFNFDTSIKVKNGNHYTFLLEFTKSDGITYFSHNPNLSISSLNVTDDPNNLINYDISPNLSNISINWARFTSDLRSTNWAFLLVEFDIDNVNFNDIYLQDIYITFDDGENPSNVQPIPLPNLMFSNGSVDYEYSVDAYFIENGSIQFNGWNCDYLNDSDSCYFSENYFDPDYDYTYASDIRVFENIPQCSDNDIICHIKQVFSMIKSFFIRMSNFFREIMYPNNDFTVAQLYFDTFHLDDGGLASVITAPLGVIQSLDVNSCEPISFTFPMINQEITFPCLKSSVYSAYFPQLLVIFQLLSTGCICYFCCSSIFKKIRSMQNPDTNDKLEVVDL